VSRLICRDEVASTNEVLFRAPLSEYPPGTALLAARQTAGRGRAQRAWASAEGGMYLSVVLLPSSPEGLTLLGAYCVLRLCYEEWGVPALLRWPNDLYCQGRKLCGVLPQVKFHGQTMERAVLGIGLNVCQRSFPPEVQAVTLAQLVPDREWQVEPVARRVLAVLDEELERFNTEGCAALASRCEPFLEGLKEGREVGILRGDTIQPLGRVRGLGSGGELLLTGARHLAQLGPDERLVVGAS